MSGMVAVWCRPIDNPLAKTDTENSETLVKDHPKSQPVWSLVGGSVTLKYEGYQFHKLAWLWMVAFPSLARIVGEYSTIRSSPVLFFFFF